MLTWADVHAKINKASHEYSLLQNHFNTYFNHVQSQVNEPVLKSKGIQVSKSAPDCFTSNFAGRDLTFVFTTILNGSGSLTGRVTCYMLCKFPEEKFIQVDYFEFSTSSKTTLVVEENDDDPAELDHDAHALCIFLESLYKSLSH